VVAAAEREFARLGSYGKEGGIVVTALPDWMDLADGLTAEHYDALPEDICRSIEIVDGAIVVDPAPRRLH
jgi:hypothetical protein